MGDSFATFHVSLWEDEVGGNGTTQTGVTDNDSIIHVQTFKDYYAYDDGTAEKAYALMDKVESWWWASTSRWKTSWKGFGFTSRRFTTTLQGRPSP